MELAEKLKNINLKNNTSLYKHVQDIISEMIKNDEKNPFENFEKYSERLNRKSNSKNENLIFDDHKNFKEELTVLREFLNINPLEKKRKDGEDEEEEEEEETEPVNLGEIRDLQAENRISSRCGISLGEEKIYYLQKAIEQFAKKYQATKITFWGQILTQSVDYYIIKVNLESGEEEEESAEDHEPEGTGINTDIFFVSIDLTDPNKWRKLPLVTSLQMRQARKLNYIFSGKLDKKIISSPPFKGLEIHLLKAQIVRIDHSTSLIPKGDYLIRTDEADDEEDDPTLFIEIEKEEEPKPRNLEFYWDKSSWLHHKPSILKQGRIKHQEITFGEDDETEEEELGKIKKYAVSLDPFENRLKPIIDDKNKNLDNCWNFQYFGKRVQSVHPITKKPVSDCILKIQSNLWPGFNFFFTNNKVFSIYIGFGRKYTNVDYYPKFEYELQNEEPELPLCKEMKKPEEPEEEEENNSQDDSN